MLGVLSKSTEAINMAKVSLKEVSAALDFENTLQNDLDSDTMDREHREFDIYEGVEVIAPEQAEDWSSHWDDQYYYGPYDDPYDFHDDDYY